jgi:hypothetical protein
LRKVAPRKFDTVGWVSRPGFRFDHSSIAGIECGSSAGFERALS